MSYEKNGLAHKIKRESNLENQVGEKEEDKRNSVLFTKFSSVIVDGLLDKEKVEQYNNNHNKVSISIGESATATELAEAKGLPPKTNKRFQLNFPSQEGEDKEGNIFGNQNSDYFYSSCLENVKGGNGNDASSAELSSSRETCYNLVCTGISAPRSSSSGNNASLIKQDENNLDSYRQIESASPDSLSSSLCWSDSSTPPSTGRSGFYSLREDIAVGANSLLEGDQQGNTTSLESASSGATVSFLTEIEVKPIHRQGANQNTRNSKSDEVNENDVVQQANSLLIFGKMETSDAVESAEAVDKEEGGGKDEQVENKGEEEDGGGDQNQQSTQTPPVDLTCKDKGEEGRGRDEGEEEEEGDGADREDGGEEGREGEGFDGDDDDEDDDTTTLSSEAVVDDIELILMPEMCQDMSSDNLSPKLVRVTELKLNADDVFCDDDDDEDQSGRHEFRSIVDEVCEEEEGGAGQDQSRLSIGDDDVSSGSELISGGGRRRHGGGGGGGGGVGESSKSSSSSGGRRRRSTSGRINSGVQTDITAVDEPTPISSGHGFRKRSPGKSSGRLGIPGGSNGKKLNWKSELTLLPSKMKVKQSGFNSFESNDDRDQYSPRVAKFTSQDTLNLSSQFLKPSTLYRTRNLSRNLNQFASSESTFMLPMSSEQQLSSCGVGDSSRTFRDRVSSSTSAAGVGGACSGAGNFKGAATSYSAYQISSILSGSNSGAVGGMGGMGGMGTPLSSARLVKQPHHHQAHQPLISGYSSGGAGHMMMMTSRHFRSSMPDLNAVNKSYAAVAAATMADSHRRRQPNSKSIKHSSTSQSARHRHPHHHSSTSSAGGFRLQKRSSSDEETSSLIDESERCLRSSIDLLLTDELPSPGGACGGGGGATGGDSSCFRSSRFGGSSAANVGGPGGFYYYSTRRSCSQPILNDQAYPPEMRDPSMGSPFLPRKLSDMRCSRWAKVILPNGHVAVVSVKETDEIQDSLTIHTDTGCVINLPFRKVVFAWRSGKR